MFRTNLFDNPIFIFIFFALVAMINIVFSVEFIGFLLAGVVFSAMIRTLERSYYYSSIYLVLIFSFIESTQGLPFFSLSLITFFIKIFIVPYMKFTLSSINAYAIFMVMIFYFFISVLFQMTSNMDIALLMKLLINFAIDIVIVSMII